MAAAPGRRPVRRSIPRSTTSRRRPSLANSRSGSTRPRSSTPAWTAMISTATGYRRSWSASPGCSRRSRDEVARITARHGRVTVLLIHGWNIIEPRVDLGLGLKERNGRLHPTRGAHIAADDEFIQDTAHALATRLRQAGIVPTFGLRYPGGAAQNLLQAFTPRHAASDASRGASARQSGGDRRDQRACSSSFRSRCGSPATCGGT